MDKILSKILEECHKALQIDILEIPKLDDIVPLQDILAADLHPHLGISSYLR